MVVKAKPWLARKPTRLDLEEAKLLANVFAEPPDDDRPRLVYADWLMEKNDPRGEFISLQCRLARMSPSDPEYDALSRRADEIENDHAEEWRKAFGWPEKSMGRPQYVRGFIETVDVDAKVLMPIAAALFEREPVRKLRLRALKPAALVEQFLAFEGFRRVEDIDFWGQNSFSGKTIGAIVSSPNLANVKRLRLYTCGLGAKGVKGLAEKLDLPKLVTLEFGGNKMGDEGVRALAGRKTLPPELYLNNETVTAEGVQALAASPALESVRTLSLQGNWREFGDAAAAALAASPHAANLVDLRLGSCEIGPKGAAALASAKGLGALKRLSLGGNEGIGIKGIRSLTAGIVRRLEMLEVDRCGLGEEGAREILDSDPPELRELKIANDVGPGFLDRLLASPLLKRLRTFKWESDEIPIDQWVPILTREPSPLAHLEAVYIGGFEGTFAQARDFIVDVAKRNR